MYLAILIQFKKLYVANSPPCSWEPQYPKFEGHPGYHILLTNLLILKSPGNANKKMIWNKQTSCGKLQTQPRNIFPRLFLCMVAQDISVILSPALFCSRAYASNWTSHELQPRRLLMMLPNTGIQPDGTTGYCSKEIERFWEPLLGWFGLWRWLAFSKNCLPLLELC